MPETLTSTTSQAPWAAQSPYLTSGFQAAQNLYLQPAQNQPSSGPTVYEPRGYNWFTDPNFATNPLGAASTSTVANLTPETRNLVSAVQNLATATGTQYPTTPGTAFNVLNPAEQYASKAIAGDYLSPSSNPYLADMVTAASQAAQDQFLTQSIPGLSSRFGMSGRTGSQGMGNAFNQLSAGYGRGIADIATNIYGTAYENERQRQQEMAMFAPDLLQARTGMYGAGIEAQDILNEQAQRELTDRVNRFNFEQQQPSDALQRYLKSVSGTFGQQTTNTEQVFQPEQWTQILGGLGTLASSGLLGGILNSGGDFVDWLGGLF
jgi:hypothetical protein